MRIAIQSCFGNTPTAERELVQRFHAAAQNLGWEAACCLTSAEIVRFRPDCVLASHFTSPKLTEFPTLGLMTNPPQYFAMFPGSLDNVLSYDGYLTGSERITEYLGDLLFSTGKKAPISGFFFHLSCPRTELVARDDGPRRLFYIGMRWDKGRHGSLFERLAGAVRLDAYGPAQRWDDLPGAYRGQIPFDGISVLDRIRESGAALCIHSAEHRAWGIPTMRIWEATAAGAVVITDVADFARQHFGDALLYIDLDRPEEDVVAQIAAHMDWINRHPEQAAQLVRRAHAVFCERFCLEVQLARLPAFVEEVRRAGQFAEVGPACRAGPSPVSPVRRDLPLVECIVRAGTRPASFLDRCLTSLREQSYPSIGVIIVPVQSGEEAALQEVHSRYKADFASFRVLPPQSAGLRSHALWAGLRAVEAPFFAILDDDDRLHPNHVASLTAVLRDRPDVTLAHSAGIRVQEEPGFWEDGLHLRGPTGAPVGEDRRLECFAGIDRKAMLKGERVLLSHCWIARRESLDERILADPNLAVLEDLYLLSLLVLKGSTAFTFRPTAEWNWRSATCDNAIFQEELVTQCRERLRRRLWFVPEMESLRREEQAAEAVQEQLRELHKEIAAFGWVGDPEMLALRRSTQMLLVLRGLRRVLRNWKTLREQPAGGAGAVRKRGLRGFLSRMASLGRE